MKKQKPIIEGKVCRTAAAAALLFSVLMFLSCPNPTDEKAMANPVLVMKALPSNISSFDLRVSGPGRDPVELSFAAGATSITIELPPGKDITFELTANIDPASPKIFLSHQGSATTDLTAGETKTITLDMDVSETKLLIPDHWNNRLVIMNDMSGAGWTELTSADLPSVTNFYPYDVDIDSQGRIYIANNDNAQSEMYIVRIDDITGANDTVLIDDPSDDYILGLAVNEENGYIYYTTEPNCCGTAAYLKRSNLDGSNVVTLLSDLTTPSIYSARGVAVDQEGNVYLAHSNDEVLRWPSGQTYTIPAGGRVFDVMVRDDYVYAANFDWGGANNTVIKLTKNLNYVTELQDKPGGGDSMFGPHRFLAVISKKAYLIDEDRSTTDERLLAVTDISGAGWTSYGQYGTGTGKFNFYYDC